MIEAKKAVFATSLHDKKKAANPKECGVRVYVQSGGGKRRGEGKRDVHHSALDEKRKQRTESAASISITRSLHLQAELRLVLSGGKYAPAGIPLDPETSDSHTPPHSQ